MTVSFSGPRPDRTLSRAMALSLGIGVLMLVIKSSAYLVTNSAAIFSDAAESVVHVVAVGFAAYSLRLVTKRSDRSHPFGYDRISFFSAGFEGAMIILAAVFILYEAGLKFVHGPQLAEVDLGAIISGLVLLVNGVLGAFLIRIGRARKSLILEANGRHVLTDAVTSGGVLIGLLLVLFFPKNWIHIGTWTFDPAYFDPIFAILAALNILKAGGKLMVRAVRGLMDKMAPEDEKKIEGLLAQACAGEGVEYHEARFRNSGNRYWLQFHLIFDDSVQLKEAHRTATRIEQTLESQFPGAVITTHLETKQDHDKVHTDEEEKMVTPLDLLL
ncbi:MAG: cation transporter [Spirochaetales bacterium]|nr:cation transporter [Spirochaetales bacterium]